MDLKKLTIFGIFFLFAFIWCFKMATAASNEIALKADASNDGDDVAYAPDDWTMDGVYDHKRCGLPLKPLSPTTTDPSAVPKIRAKRYKPHGDKPGNSTSSKKIGREEERKVMGGKAVQDGDFPWAVAIYAYGQYICSGTLISKRHVLTAAHCFQTLIDTGDGSCTIEGDSKERPIIPIWPLELENVLKHYEVHLGSICLGDEEDFIRHEACKTTRGMQKFRLKSAIYQDWFRADCTGEDYALLELDLNDGQLPAEIANHICLVHRHDEVAGRHDWNYNTELDQIVTVFGWGTNPVIENPDDPELPMYTLQRLEMPEIWSAQDCKENLGKWYRDDIICTMEKRNEDVCKGDSGGGLISQFENESGEKRWYLLGAVSSGSDCIKLQKNTETPSAQYYTNVPMHNASIDNFTGIGQQQPEFKQARNINAVGPRSAEKVDDAGDDLSDYDCDY